MPIAISIGSTAEQAPGLLVREVSGAKPSTTAAIQPRGPEERPLGAVSQATGPILNHFA